jgi:hypothetical protein
MLAALTSIVPNHGAASLFGRAEGVFAVASENGASVAMIQIGGQVMTDLARQRFLLSVLLISAINLGWCGCSWAQAVDLGTDYNPNNTQAETFDRGENVSVRQRPRPDYEAKGIHVGGFLIYPKLTAGVAYDDNIFAVQSGVVGDAIFNLSPEVDIQSTWSRDALDAYVRASQDFYTHYTSENATQYGAGLSGKLEFGNSILITGVDYGRYVLPRSAPNNGLISEHRIAYDYTAANAEFVHTFNRLRLSERVDYQIYAYQNGETSNGLLVLEQDQNHNAAIFTSKAEYAVGPDAAVFVQGAFNTQRYGLNPPTVPYTRNSNGFDVAAGANFDLTHLIRGEFQLGYMDQRYVSPLFKPITGLSAKGQIEWFPTQLTTVTLTALRAVEASGIINSAGYVTTVGGFQVDHELLRNVILGANATVGRDQYVGVDRNDEHWGGGVSANWLLNRLIGLTLAYTFTHQTSIGVDRGPSFNDNRITLSTVLQF